MQGITSGGLHHDGHDRKMLWLEGISQHGSQLEQNPTHDFGHYGIPCHRSYNGHGHCQCWPAPEYVLGTNADHQRVLIGVVLMYGSGGYLTVTKGTMAEQFLNESLIQ